MLYFVMSILYHLFNNLTKCWPVEPKQKTKQYVDQIIRKFISLLISTILLLISTKLGVMMVQIIMEFIFQLTTVYLNFYFISTYLIIWQNVDQIIRKITSLYTTSLGLIMVQIIMEFILHLKFEKIK